MCRQGPSEWIARGNGMNTSQRTERMKELKKVRYGIKTGQWWQSRYLANNNTKATHWKISVELFRSNF